MKKAIFKHARAVLTVSGLAGAALCTALAVMDRAPLAAVAAIPFIAVAAWGVRLWWDDVDPWTV